jgi:hypothetical protein
MDTNSKLRVAAASVIGARHQRAGRNGQDAVFAVCGGDLAVAVVCDGCSSGASSEVGARLGARWFAERVAHALAAGDPIDRATFEAARRDLASRLAALANGDGNKVHKTPLATSSDHSTVEGRLQNAPSIDVAAVHELLLFTIVAAAVTRDGAAVWALGDGAYGFDGTVRVLGPFADNAPPYLAYDLLGDPREASFEALPATARRIVIATDGVEAFDYDLAVFGAVSTANPDALRRRLTMFARGDERVAWSEGRVVRTPAVLQDDCAVAIVERLS